MGIFKKFGSFATSAIDKASGIFSAKKAKSHGTFSTPTQTAASPSSPAGDSGGRLRNGAPLTTGGLREAIDAAARQTRDLIEGDMSRAFDHDARGNQPRSTALFDDYQSELAKESAEDIERRRKYIEREERNMDPYLRFLGGELQYVTSSNVDWIQYDRNKHLLYIGYKNGASYVYYDVDPVESSSLYNAGSKGRWVWDELRVRGTVFGYKKNYAFLEYTLGGYQPRYMDNSGWQAEHAAIPPNGDLPMTWAAGKGPYADIPWYGIPSKKSEEHRLPEATVFEEIFSPRSA